MQNQIKHNFAVIADPHYYSNTLGIEGESYRRRAESDQKLLAETPGVMKSALEAILASDAEFLLIAGDLTNDGELASHREIRDLLYEFKKQKPVYVITATHDWCCDNNPRRFVGNEVFHDVQTLGPDELRDFYKDFGPGDSVAEYFTHLKNSSYVVRPFEGVSVFCLNDDQNGEGGSGYSDDHFLWIEEQVKAARARGDVIFGMQHHHLFLTEFDRVINGKSSVDYRQKQAERFANIGFSVMFVGHSHMQHIRRVDTDSNKHFYEVNVASISGYPAPIAYCTVTNNGIDIKTKPLESFCYNGRMYYNDFMKEHATYLFQKVINAALHNEKKEFSALLESLSISEDKANKYWKFARPALKKLDSLTVKKAARIINGITFGKAIDKKAAADIADTRVVNIIFDTFLALLDGSVTVHSPDSAYYKVFTGALSVPLTIVNKLHIKNGGLIRTLTHLKAAAPELMTGGPLNNNDFFLDF